MRALLASVISAAVLESPTKLAPVVRSEMLGSHEPPRSARVPLALEGDSGNREVPSAELAATSA